MNKRSLFLIGFCFFILSLNIISATLNVSLSDQGTDVKDKSTGNILTSGNLSITIYDALSGGNLIYNETFIGGIVNGSWNVMLGENSSNSLSLEFGKVYYKDYAIDGSDLDFIDFQGNTVERQFFYSPLGDIAGEDISESANLTIANLTLSQKITFAFEEIIDNIVDGWVRVTGGLNVTENIQVSGNVTADYFFGNGSQLTGISGASPGGTEGAIQFYDGGSFDGNVSQFFINKTSGEVGIGTSSPDTLLDVEDNAVTIATIQTTATNAEYAGLNVKSPVGIWGLYTGTTSHSLIAGDFGIFDVDAGVYRFVIKDNGYVGIGTSNPGRKLDIEGTASVYMEFDATDYSQFVIGSESRGFVIYDDTTNDYRMVIQNGTGNVGIGTDSPEKPLEVSGVILVSNKSGTASWGYQLWSASGNPRYGLKYGDEGDIGISDNLMLTNREVSGNLTFGTSGATGGSGGELERMRITHDGNVGIGLTAPGNKLSVYGGDGENPANPLVQIFNAETTAAEGDGLFIKGGANSDSSKTLEVQDLSGNTDFVILGGGNVGIGITTPSTNLEVGGTYGSGKIGYSLWGKESVSVNSSTFAILTHINGSVLNSAYQYRISLITQGTATDTGAQYLVWYDADTSAWNVRFVNRRGSSSNHPEIFLDSGTPKIKTSHANLYTVSVIKEAINSVNSNSEPAIWGASYMWQKDIGDIFYTDGNVGIGDATPTTKLDVAGTGRFYSATNAGQISFGSGTQGRIVLATPTLATMSFDMWDGSGYTTPIFAEITGVGTSNVGIGTTSPDSDLEVYTGPSNDARGIVISQGGGNSGRLFFVNGTSGVGNAILKVGNDLQFTTGATPGSSSGAGRMFLQDDGNVGIGTASPDYKLEIAGTATYAESDAIIELYRNAATSNGNYVGTLRFTGKDSAANEQSYVKIAGIAEQTTSESERGGIKFFLMGNDPGAMDEAFRFHYDGTAEAEVAWNTFSPYLVMQYIPEDAKKEDYEIGDIVIIKNRKVFLSTESYQTNVLGVIVPREGFISTPKDWKNKQWDQEKSLDEFPGVPVAYIGDVKVKVSTENGLIESGDPLVSSSILGVGMKGEPNDFKQYSGVIGKAREPFNEEGIGLIEVALGVK